MESKTLKVDNQFGWPNAHWLAKVSRCRAMLTNAWAETHTHTDMQRKAKAGQRQAIVGQSFPVQAHAGQRWSWRAKGFRAAARNRCVLKQSGKSSRKIRELRPGKNPAGESRKSGSGGPGLQKFPGFLPGTSSVGSSCLILCAFVHKCHPQDFVGISIFSNTDANPFLHGLY